MPRLSWDEVPAPVRTAVERAAGPVLDVEDLTAGRNSDVSAVLRTADGLVFCKGVEGESGVRGRAHRHEADVNGCLPRAVAPRLRWRVEVEGWLLLGFDHVPGRYADLAPGSPDLRVVAGVVDAMARGLADCPMEVPRLAEQWGRLAAWRRLAQDPPADLHPWALSHFDELIAFERVAIEGVDGGNLAHTDLHPLNVLVEGGQARVVDWAWSRLAAPVVDVAFLVVRLVLAGHEPGEAEAWAEGVGCWAAAPVHVRTGLSVAVWGIWEYLLRSRAAAHQAELTAAARSWALWRLCAV